VDGTPRDGILSAFAKMQSEMMKGINKHVLHKNTVARKISKISKIVKQAIGDVI
jgi:ribosomal protein S20